MKESILIAGGSGLVGQRLAHLLKDKYHIHILSRSKRKSTSNVTYFRWDLDRNEIDTNALEVDHIINLNGAGIADKRWTASRKKILIKSRVQSNILIAEGLKKINHNVQSIQGASAIGFYGNRDNEILNEESAVGQGFMAECCRLWEDSSNLLKPFTARHLILRIGIVLSSKGGALPKTLMTKNMGLLSYFGNGNQYYSWIHIDDLCGMMIKALSSDDYKGIINAVSPTPITNKDMISEIKESLKSNALILPALAFSLKLAMGEMSDVVLNSNRVLPVRLTNINFNWQHPDVGTAINDVLQKEI